MALIYVGIWQNYYFVNLISVMKSDINYLIRENTFLKSKRMNVVN